MGCLHRAYDLMWERVNKQGNVFIHNELSLLEGRKRYYMLSTQYNFLKILGQLYERSPFLLPFLLRPQIRINNIL